jgi:hypothetical protein
MFQTERNVEAGEIQVGISTYVGLAGKGMKGQSWQELGVLYSVHCTEPPPAGGQAEITLTTKRSRKCLWV